MVNKTMVFLTIIILGVLTTTGQNIADKNNLRNDFILDSLGCLGKRLAYIDSTTIIQGSLTNKNRKRILIAGIDLINQKADTLEILLGKSNEFAHRSEATRNGESYSIIEIDHDWYYLTTCGKNKKGEILVITTFCGIIKDISIINQ
jgi:hypothetical protein